MVKTILQAGPLQRGQIKVFGELAILEDTKRTTSVRAKSAVDLLVMSREDFAAMVENFTVLDDYFDRLVKERYPERAHSQAPLADRIAKPVPVPGPKRVC